LKKIINALEKKRLIFFIKELIRFKIYCPLVSLCNKILDLRYRIDTEDIIELKDLGFNPNVGVRYESIPYWHIERIMKSVQTSNNDILVDMGSGKGRILCIASKYKFKKIIGLEISKKLISICHKNMNSFNRELLCSNYELNNCNANDFTIPSNANISFFFNPLKKVLKNIKESIIDNPRELKIVFYNLFN